MTANDKISKGLKTAMTYLENSLLALDKKDENLFIESVWHAAAELEYALFLFSIAFQNESSTSKWKPNPDLKKVGTHTMLAEAQNLLKEAEKQVANDQLLDSYKNAYIARHYILKVQEDIAKKKREAFKKK